MNSSCAIAVAAACESRAAQYLKLDHLGEQIAVCIYAAQSFVCRWTAPGLVPMLAEFMIHERRHEQLFGSMLRRRRLTPCRGATLLMLGGGLLGAATAIFGKTGVMACTAAVETAVLDHLRRQLDHLRSVDDASAVGAIESILADELAHRDIGVQGSSHGTVYRVLHWLVGHVTASVIALGMHL
jgi:3-demethoxyubiquinol 3-hydroxylase